MYPITWAQDVLRCRLCETPSPPMYCDICHIHLCKACAGAHLSNEFMEHKVIPFEKRGLKCTTNYPKCQTHSTKQCELHCEQCDIPICPQCISSGEHEQHRKNDILKIIENKTFIIQRDLKELKKTIHPKYQKIASSITFQKADIHENTKKLTTIINEHGEDLQRKINSMIQKLKSDIEEMDSKYLAVLNKQEDKINHTISEITQIIADLKKLLNSNDASLVSVYKSRNTEFRKLPPKLKVSLPNFIPQKINTEQLYQQFGSLSAFTITTEEDGYKIETSEAGSPPLKPLLDESQIISTIQTRFGGCLHTLSSVTCHSDEEIWTCCSSDQMMSLYNMKEELVKSIQTKSGNGPYNIIVTMSGDLVYTDCHDRTVNMVTKTQIHTVIKLQGWKPRGVCSTSIGDLLVVLESDDDKPTKVVCYSGSTEKQTIQFNDKGKPLYSSHGNKYISLNRNLDICVSDNRANAVVVVNQFSKIRFTYSGRPSNTKGLFYPRGITTDSQGRILTADYHNNRIHILDQDGQFDNCHLQDPWGLCVDTRDNIFVTEWDNGKVKKIKYCV